MLRLLTLFLVLVVFAGCQKEEEEEEEHIITETPITSSMNFDELVKGQVFKYTMLEAHTYFDEDYFDFTYTNDTLLIEILDRNGNEVLVSESLSKGSNIFSASDDYYWDQEDSTYINTWLLENDSLTILGNSLSHLLPINRYSLETDTSFRVDVKGWKTSHYPISGNKLLFTSNYYLKGIHYDTLGISLNNAPLSYDGTGSTVFYSKIHGIVRTSKYHGWPSEGQGWDRIK